MKISVITATFNSSATVRDTLESMLLQTNKDVEYIIKDGGSKDETIAICRQYESKFDGRLIVLSCPDNGIYDAMNQGIEAATGDIVGILNSNDVFYDERVLERVAQAFVNDAEIGCVYGDLEFVDANDITKVVRVWKGSEYVDGGFRRGWHPAHPTFYARREFFKKYGAFDTAFDVSADFELMLRFMERYHVKGKYIPENFVKMRMGGESTGSIRNIIKGNKNILLAFKKNGFKRPPFYTIRRLAPKAIAVLKNRISSSK